MAILEGFDTSVSRLISFFLDRDMVKEVYALNGTWKISMRRLTTRLRHIQRH